VVDMYYTFVIDKSYENEIYGAVHKWCQSNFRDFWIPTPLSVPNSHSLPSFGQKLANQPPSPLLTSFVNGPFITRKVYFFLKNEVIFLEPSADLARAFCLKLGLVSFDVADAFNLRSSE